MDTFVPGPADIVALGLLVLTCVVAVGVEAYQYNKVRTKERAQTEVDTIAIPEVKKEDSTFIYRKGSGNGTNLTPREVDMTGLSYSLTPPIGVDYTVTTIEAVNETGVLTAIVDGPNHVSVRPTNPAEMPIWINSRPTAKEKPYYLTIILSNISSKVKGVKCDGLSD